METKILIVCGEPSGDLNAGLLAEEIKKLLPDTLFYGVGGEFLRRSGACLYADIQGLSAIGLFEALKKLPVFFKLKKTLLEKISREKPDALILVDFSGFNLRLAKAVKKSLPVIYYISPQVWASRRGRLKTIKKYVNKLIVLFKFEQEFYHKHSINVDFAGHPLLDKVRPQRQTKEFLSAHGLSLSLPVMALLPGSRQAEVRHILPVMLESARLAKKRIPGLQLIIAKSSYVEKGLYARIIRSRQIPAALIERETYDCINAAGFCLIASGTATLEAAILEKPFAVIYKTSLLNYLFYLPQLKTPYISMPNIIANRRIIPEFIQFQATAENISRTATEFFINPSLIDKMRFDLKQVKESLGEPGASGRAAGIIADFLTNRPASNPA